MTPFTCPACKRSFLVPDDPAARECPACHTKPAAREPLPPGVLGELTRLRRLLARRVEEREAALAVRPTRGASARNRPAGPPGEPRLYRWAERIARSAVALGTLACLAGVGLSAACAADSSEPAVSFLVGTAACVVALAAVLSSSCLVLIAVDIARTLRNAVKH
jgi:hypothetical protein